MPLRVAVVHYHFRRGGVTSVVKNALTSLAAQDVQCALLAGEPSDVLKDVRVVEGLGYAETNATEPALAGPLRAAAREALGGEPDLWHVHNHSLGKNTALPQAVHDLASDGCRLLLQVHDFAEDGRPGNYERLRKGLPSVDTAWPAASHVHYAVLNARDRRFLAGAGAPAAELHDVPNAVSVPGCSEALSPQDAAYDYLYVTRAIRRKNLGELLLWAAAYGGKARFGVSRAPANPEARPVYDRWVELAGELDLPVAFEVGKRADALPELIGRSRRLITTSVAEGFGLAFLEPWAAGRGLVGRVLPEIVEDTRAAGVNLDGLYERLSVPTDWVGEGDLRDRIDTALRRTRSAYGRATDPLDVAGVFETMAPEGRVDFGRLDEALQTRVIRNVVATPDARGELAPGALEPRPVSDELVAANAAVVREKFGLRNYGRRLAELYGVVAASEPSKPGTLSCEKLLDAFLAPERFNLLRTS
jgi:glycosyltransferase involved in cell wall biosynthesis